MALVMLKVFAQSEYMQFYKLYLINLTYFCISIAYSKMYYVKFIFVHQNSSQVLLRKKSHFHLYISKEAWSSFRKLSNCDLSNYYIK